MACGPTPDRRLRLVSGQELPQLRCLVEAVEATYAGWNVDMLRSLADVEAALVGADQMIATAMQEQIAFIRVGLRCLADAIGELQSWSGRSSRPALGPTTGAG
jgi:hypothetical protein